MGLEGVRDGMTEMPVEEALRLLEESSDHGEHELDRWRNWISENYSHLDEKEVWILRHLIVLGSYTSEGFAYVWTEETTGTELAFDDVCPALMSAMLGHCEHLASLGLIEDTPIEDDFQHHFEISSDLRRKVKELFPRTDYPHETRLWHLIQFANRRYNELDPMNDGTPCDGNHKMVQISDIIRIGLEDVAKA